VQRNIECDNTEDWFIMQEVPPLTQQLATIYYKWTLTTSVHMVWW